MEQALEYHLSCPTCGRTATGWRGQELSRDTSEVRWFDEWECTSCAMVSDDGGAGPGPESLRRALLDAFGGAVIDAPTREIRVIVMRELREMFELSPARALAALKESGPDNPLGTRVEIQAVVQEIERSGFA